jgi:hypothetical protein
MQIPIIAAALASGLVLTACGAEKPAAGDRRTEGREAALAFAKCMRDQGIDMPDPQFDENGGAQIRIGRGSGIDINDPKFRKAQEACRDKMPMLGNTDEEER